MIRRNSFNLLVMGLILFLLGGALAFADPPATRPATRPGTATTTASKPASRPAPASKPAPPQLGDEKKPIRTLQELLSFVAPANRPKDENQITEAEIAAINKDLDQLKGKHVEFLITGVLQTDFGNIWAVPVQPIKIVNPHITGWPEGGKGERIGEVLRGQQFICRTTINKVRFQPPKAGRGVPDLYIDVVAVTLIPPDQRR